MIDPEEVLAAAPEQENTTTTEPEAIEAAADEETVENETPAPVYQTKAEVMSRLRELSAQEEAPARQELDLLKQVYYKLQKQEAFDAFKAFVDSGGDANEYVQPVDETEAEFKTLQLELRARRAEETAQLERMKAENLQAKLQIIEEIKAMAETPEQAANTYESFKALQSRWREIGPVPAEQATTLWKTYQLYVEHFYDALRQNIEMREYDFRKNLEIKTSLCEKAEALAAEEDVLKAFDQLQGLHQQWKETGPVAKDLREEIWNRFKVASTVINKRHQDHFLAIKERAEENLALKTALCEKAESVSTEGLTSVKGWEEMTKVVTDLQAEWRTIGFATQKMNAKIFERFRLACDAFFRAKADFFKTLRSEQAANLEKKTALCEQAEALKDSTEWRATAEKLVALQKEWKTIGAVPRKVSDQLWQRFNAACDTFFAARQEAEKDTRNEEHENLKKKKDIIARLQVLANEGAQNAEGGTSQERERSGNLREAIRVLQNEWNEVGHVPYRDKEKIYKEYRALCDQLFDTLGKSMDRRRMDGFKRTMKQVAEQGGSALSRERERLLRIRDNMRQEIATYENNLGFLSAGSKSGNSLIDQMKRKAEKLRDELALLQEKIKTLEIEMRKEREQQEQAQ